MGAARRRRRGLPGPCVLAGGTGADRTRQLRISSGIPWKRRCTGADSNDDATVGARDRGVENEDATFGVASSSARAAYPPQWPGGLLAERRVSIHRSAK